MVIENSIKNYTSHSCVRAYELLSAETLYSDALCILNETKMTLEKREICGAIIRGLHEAAAEMIGNLYQTPDSEIWTGDKNPNRYRRESIANWNRELEDRCKQVHDLIMGT